MTDREMLELAAKAGGIDYVPEFSKPHHSSGAFWGLWLRIKEELYEGQQRYWNSLTDRGETLMLATKLGLSITPYPIYEQPKHSVLVELKAHAECPNALAPLRYCANCTDPCQLKRSISVLEPYGDNPGAATRRAITRAAAEIGKGLLSQDEFVCMFPGRFDDEEVERARAALKAAASHD